MLYKIKIKTEKKRRENAEIVVIFIATTIIAMMVVKSRDVKVILCHGSHAAAYSGTYSLNYKTVFVNSQKTPGLVLSRLSLKLYMSTVNGNISVI